MILPAQWDNSFSVGNEQLDEQHRQAFDMLQSAMRVLRDSAPSLSHFHGYLEYFLSFLELHFATEEAILARNSCPSLVAHKLEHDSMLEALRELRLAAIGGTVDNARLPQIAFATVSFASLSGMAMYKLLPRAPNIDVCAPWFFLCVM